MSAAAPRFPPCRKLGRTGFVATRLGAGDLADRQLPLEDCVRTLVRALDAGLNVVDTAPAYEDGYSEEIVGRALPGRRESVFLIDKIDHLHEPVAPQVGGSFSSGGVDDTRPVLPRLSVEECVRYTLTLDPDVALLGLSFPNEQDAAFAAAVAFAPLSEERLTAVRRRAADAIRGKGRCWWNPEPSPR